MVQQEQKDPGRESLFAARAGAAADFFPDITLWVFYFAFCVEEWFPSYRTPMYLFLARPAPNVIFFEESFDEHAHQQATTQLNPSDML